MKPEEMQMNNQPRVEEEMSNEDALLEYLADLEARVSALEAKESD